MKKIIAFIIFLMLINIGFLSGCEEKSANIPPIVSVTAEPMTGFQPLEVSFNISAEDTDGTIKSCRIEFGDGTSSTYMNANHTYNFGTYKVVVTAIDDKGASTNESLTIIVKNQAPIAYASADISFGKPPLNVRFSGIGNDSDGYIGSYYWDFDDGETSEMQNPTHIFNQLGKTFTVVFTVTDNNGETATDIVTITTSDNELPTAKATASPRNGEAPLKVNFFGTGTDTDGTIESYYWEFGDGYTSTQKNPTHTYSSIGTYTATLTVTDNNDATDTASITITVYAHQESWIHVASYYGVSGKVTDTFKIQGVKFKIICTVDGDPNYGYWYIYIYPEGETAGSVFHQSIDLDDYPGGYASETSYCYEGAGTYYCKIGAANIDGGWTVDIYDWR